MSKKYILDTNSIINQLKLGDKGNKFSKDKYSVDLLEKVLNSIKISLNVNLGNVNFRNLDSYILVYDGVVNTKITHLEKLSELQNDFVELGNNISFINILDIQFSGSIFSSNDVLKRFIRLNKEPVILVSDDFDLCSMAINNQNKFLRPEEFLLKLKFLGEKDFEIEDEIASLSNEIRHSKSTVESDTFNLLDYFKTNELNSTILENTIDGNVRKVPKFEELQKNGEFKNKKKQSPNLINETVINKLNQIEIINNYNKIETQKISKDMLFKNKENNSSDKKSFNSLEDLSNLLDIPKDKQSKREIKKANRLSDNSTTESPYKKHNDALEKDNSTNSADVDYFLNIFSK